MDNIITSTLLQSLTQVSGGKNISAVPQELPQGLNIGDFVLLETILNTDTFQSGDLFKLSWQPKQGQPQEFMARLNTPLHLEGEIGETRQFAARIMADGSLQLQPLKPNLQTSSLSAPPITRPQSASLPHIDFQPIKIAPVIENLMTDMKFPLSLKNFVAQNLPPTEVLVELKAVNQSFQFNDEVLAPLKSTLSQMLSVADKPQQLTTLVQNLLQNIKGLNGQTINARPLPSAELPSISQGAVFDTPLGKVFSELPIKLPLESSLQLDIKTSATDKIFDDFPLLKELAETLSKVLPKEGFVRIEPQNLLQLVRNQDDAAAQLLKIFEPLQEAPQLMSAVVQKFAGVKADLLQNIYSFYKASEKSDVSKWLGAELTAKIAETPRGAETIARLENMVNNAVRETPLWRIIDVPLFDGSRIVPLQIALKKESEEEEKKSRKSQGGVRFMINTEFVKLGAFQFDGFSQASERRLDLLIRTDRDHPQDFCSHIINLFKKSLYDVGYVGSIKINQREAFIKIEPAAASKEGLYV